MEAEEEEEVEEERKGGGVGERDTPGGGGAVVRMCVSVCLGAVVRKAGIPSSGLTCGPIPPSS